MYSPGRFTLPSSEAETVADQCRTIRTRHIGTSILIHICERRNPHNIATATGVVRRKCHQPKHRRLLYLIIL